MLQQRRELVVSAVTSRGLSELSTRLADARRLTVLTGAGVSAASGIPTFRGADGLWRNHRAEQLATPDAFARDPTLVWEWYAWRRQRVSECHPNRAHQVLADWSRCFEDFLLITQNVDGLHERAGTQEVLRFHGSLWELRCWYGCADAPAPWWDEAVPFPETPPRCPHCGNLARPGVVWFGESIDPTVLARSLAATTCDIFLTIGTSAVVHPAASLIAEAARRGAYTAEINLKSTPASPRVDVALQGPAEDVLDRLEDLLTRSGGSRPLND